MENERNFDREAIINEYLAAARTQKELEKEANKKGLNDTLTAEIQKNGQNIMELNKRIAGQQDVYEEIRKRMIKEGIL